MESVILVDENDIQIGVEEKLSAHHKGLLHRAFSVFIFNKKNEILLQKRALDKYHSAGLWTNACCSHPRPEEDTLSAAHRRLKEELGLTSSLKHLFHFIYKAAFDNWLTEHELDHVFIGITDDYPIINTEEASEYRYMSQSALLTDIDNNPEQYTVWFKLIVERVFDTMRN